LVGASSAGGYDNWCERVTLYPEDCLSIPHRLRRSCPSMAVARHCARDCEARSAPGLIDAGRSMSSGTALKSERRYKRPPKHRCSVPCVRTLSIEARGLFSLPGPQCRRGDGRQARPDMGRIRSRECGTALAQHYLRANG
jgi:hypothetical protein